MPADAELARRLTALTTLFDAFGTPHDASRLELLLEDTADVPTPWLELGVREVRRSWVGPFKMPPAGAIRHAAAKVAGLTSPQQFGGRPQLPPQRWPAEGRRYLAHGERGVTEELPQQTGWRGNRPTDLRALADPETVAALVDGEARKSKS